MIITISGVPGSGKTSVGKILAQTLGMNFYSIGGLRGKMAIERGMTIAELNALGENDPSTDTGVDDYQRELGKKEDNFIMEGRLSWYFIPQSFKILLTCDLTEGARRVVTMKRTDQASDEKDEPNYQTIEEAREAFEARMKSDAKRYEKYYDLKDFLDPTQYDLVIDTTTMPGPEATAKQILEAIKQKNG